MSVVSTSNAFLEVAREDFPSFYARGTAHDRVLMDTLVMVIALAVRINAERAAKDPGPGRQALEETCHAVHQAFTDLRDKVRARPVLNGLPTVERWKIENTIFERAT